MNHKQVCNSFTTRHMSIAQNMTLSDVANGLWSLMHAGSSCREEMQASALLTICIKSAWSPWQSSSKLQTASDTLLCKSHYRVSALEVRRKKRSNVNASTHLAIGFLSWLFELWTMTCPWNNLIVWNYVPELARAKMEPQRHVPNSAQCCWWLCWIYRGL